MGNIMAAAAYLSWVIGLIVYIIAKDDKVAKFHAMQSILANFVYSILYLIFAGIMFGLMFVITLVLAMVKMESLALIAFLPLLLVPLAGLAMLVYLLLALWKGWNNEIYKLPLIGGLAENWSR